MEAMSDIRLFVDCDDTLVLYCNGLRCEHGDVHPYGSKYDPWVPNEPLIAHIKAFRERHPDALIVVWSGGGKGYAQGFIDKLLPDLGITALDKWAPSTDLVRAADFVVDDQWESMMAGKDLQAGAYVFGPHWWPEEKA